MTIETVLLRPFEERTEKMLANFTACRNEPGEEAIHDLRVSIRRCLATIDIMAEFLPARLSQTFRDAIKPELSGLNDLRDLQVMEAFLAREGSPFAPVDPFRLYIQRRTSRERERVEKHLAGIRQPLVREKWMSRIRKDCLALVHVVGDRELVAPIDEAFRRCQKRLGRLEQREPATIHSLRIAFKRFRYAVEVVSAAIPDFPVEMFRRMQAYQTLMGEIQDADVLMAALRRYQRRHPGWDEGGSIRYAANLMEERIALFLPRAYKLEDYWRVTPADRQPWKVG